MRRVVRHRGVRRRSAVQMRHLWGLGVQHSWWRRHDTTAMWPMLNRYWAYIFATRRMMCSTGGSDVWK